MAISGVFGWLNIRRIEFSVELPDEIYDGRDTLVTIRLENRKRFIPSFLIRAEFAGVWTGFTMIRRNSVEKAAVSATIHGRGIKKVGEASIASCFPINFFIRCKKFIITEEYVVFPAPRHCNVPPGLGQKGLLREPFSRVKGSDGDVLKIIDYTGNEPLKLIHWRLSAKHEGFKVKEMASSANEPVILDLECLPGGSLERVVSCGAFLVNRFIRQNRPVGLKSGTLFIRPDTSRTHRLKLLTQLAVYGKN